MVKPKVNYLDSDEVNGRGEGQNLMIVLRPISARHTYLKNHMPHNTSISVKLALDDFMQRVFVYFQLECLTFLYQQRNVVSLHLRRYLNKIMILI